MEALLDALAIGLRSGCRPGGAVVGGAGLRQESHRQRAARAPGGRRRALAAVSMLAVLRQQRLLSDHCQFRAACSISAATRRRTPGWTSWKRWSSGTTACRVGDVRFVAAMLSLPHEERYGPLTMTPRLVKEETIRVLVDIVKAAAHAQPCLLLFEDVHWADPTTLETLGLLIDRLGGIPVLVVLTHRPEFEPPWSRYAWVTTLDLARLAPTQSRELVSNLTAGKALPDDACRADHRQDRRCPALRRGADQDDPRVRRPGRSRGSLPLCRPVRSALRSRRRCATR